MAGLLTKAEANKLIEMLKRTVEDRIAFPSQRGGVSFTVVGERRNDEFIVNIDRKGKAFEKCTYQGRVRQNNQILLRLDINHTGKHTNPGPDGKTIYGNHIHLYTEDYDLSYAIPFDVGDKDLYELCYTFFEEFHIIEPPAVFHQQSM